MCKIFKKKTEENIPKIHTHSIRRILYDILRDKNSTKYSLSKVSAFVALLLFTASVMMGLAIMWTNKKIDYILIGEIIGLILTLEGYKNSFGFPGGNLQGDGTQNTKPITNPVNTNDKPDVKEIISDITNDITKD